MATRPKAVIESRNGEKFSPITIAKNVLTDDGQNLHDILSDRKEDMMTPTIENSSSMFKVGQGDNVDYSSDVVNGAYESMVLKGKTMVNCIQEPSSQDVVLPYAFEDGQYVTINDTKESGALGIKLKGQTLVNISEINRFSINGPGKTLYTTKKLIKDNTTYTRIVYISKNTLTGVNERNCVAQLVEGSNTIFSHDIQITLNKTGLICNETFNSGTASSSKKSTSAVRIFTVNTGGVLEGYEIILEGNYTDVDIPYFEGMASCKAPILHTVGKNLFNTNKQITSNATYEVIGDELILSCSSAGWYNLKLEFFNLTPNKPYTLSYDYEILEGSPNNQVIVVDSSNTTILNNITPSDGKISIKFYCGNSTKFGKIRYYNIQLEEASATTSYEPYKSSILSLPEDLELRGIGEVKDTLNCLTGKLTERIGEGILDGSENWGVGANKEYFYIYTRFPYHSNKYPIISDKLPTTFENLSKGCLSIYIYDWGNAICFTPINATDKNSAILELQSYGDIVFQYVKKEESVKTVDLKVVDQKGNVIPTLKSWNTKTHIYSEIPENSLYPTLSHSNPSYPVILKPSTKYSIVANSYSNNHTNSAINFNLGGATASTTVGNRVTTITTPSTLSNELLTMSGRGNKLNNVMVIEGDVVGDEPYFEGMCDSKSPILSNIGETILETPFEKEFGTDAQKEFFRIVDCAEIFDNFGVGKQYTLSLDIKANKSGAARIYLQNGSGSRHSFSFDIPVTTEYVRHTKQITPTMAGNGHNFKESWLACFTTYNTGCFATIKNIRISTGEDEPYKSNILSCETYFDETTQSDKTIVLRSLPNGVCDTLNVRTGEYVQIIGEITLDGTKRDNLVYHAVLKDNDGDFIRMIINGCSFYDNNKYGNCDKLPFYHEEKIKDSVEAVFPFAGEKHFYIKIKTSRINGAETMENNSSQLRDAFLNWLAQNPITVQYELATPIVKQINVEGYPYAYENGHILLESGSQEQSLTPTIEYSIVANRSGQIRSNQRMVERHQKQLDRLQAMILTNLVNTQYEQTLTNLKYDLKNIREEVK